MEMSGDYLAETANYLKNKGLELEVQSHAYGETAKSQRYALSFGENLLLELESVSHPDAPERFYLELKRYFGMRAFSFALDSWRYFDDRVEFKFYAPAQTSVGLSFILEFELIPGLSDH